MTMAHKTNVAVKTKRPEDDGVRWSGPQTDAPHPLSWCDAF